MFLCSSVSVIKLCVYSGTSPYGHLTSKKTSPLQSPWLSPNLYSTVQITPCNKVTSPLRSLLPSPVGDLNSEVPLYIDKFIVLINVLLTCDLQCQTLTPFLTQTLQGLAQSQTTFSSAHQCPFVPITVCPLLLRRSPL